MKSGIYQIINKVNGKSYIGSSKNIKRRKQQHFSLLKKNKNHSKLLQRAFNKYKEENFEFIILALCDEENLFKLEQYFVDTLKPEYNICIENVAVPIGIDKTNIIYTEEHRQIKINSALKRIQTDVNFGWKSKKLEVLDSNNNVIEEFNSLKEFASKYNCSVANVTKAIKKNNKCKGFKVRYKTVD